MVVDLVLRVFVLGESMHVVFAFGTVCMSNVVLVLMAPLAIARPLDSDGDRDANYAL